MKVTSKLHQRGIWGPVTATLDWCEVNYQFSQYIAEMANTISNLVTIVLALHGANTIRSQGLPTRYLVGFLAFAVVGVGSFAFHATLLYTAQLADELPMIFAASSSIFMLFDSSLGFEIRSNVRTRRLLTSIILFDVIFSLSYWIYRNPIYHQVVFACLMLTIVGRARWLLRHSEMSKRIGEDARATINHLYKSGAGSFLLGFIIWNLDNIFCDTLTSWKIYVDWPAAFLLEGHSWWHILTGAGSYLMWMGTTYLTLCIKDDPRNYELGYDMRYLPHVRRLQKAKVN